MRCFVISPIGVPGSDVREHADDVFDFIIKPACERAGITPIRADHDTRPGVITEQMYDSILGDDLLIAVLSFHNPNVFYEIAIAEAAARPLILMIQHGDAIPFDIKDRRVLSYDLRPRALHNKTHEDALHRAILDTVAATRLGDRAVPFRPALSPLGAKSTSDVQVIDRTNLFDPARRIEHINAAQRFLTFRAIAWSNPPLRDELFDALDKALSRGVKARMVLMAPENPGLAQQVREFTSNYIRTMQEEIANGIEIWQQAGNGRIEMRLQTSGFMHGMLQANEHTAILTPYSLAKQTADSVCMTALSTHRLALAATEEFEFVWRKVSRPVEAPRPSRGGRSSGSSKPRSGAGRKPSARRKAGRGAASR